jgi:hypothetical protein
MLRERNEKKTKKGAKKELEMKRKNKNWKQKKKKKKKKGSKKYEFLTHYTTPTNKQ